MPWDVWKRPEPGEKVHYWQQPSLEAIDESSSSFSFTTTPISLDFHMANICKGDSWGSGGASISFATSDEWNSGSAGGDGWNDGAAAKKFNDSGADQVGNVEGSDEKAGLSGPGTCFNCGEEGHLKSGQSSLHQFL